MLYNVYVIEILSRHTTYLLHYTKLFVIILSLKRWTISVIQNKYGGNIIIISVCVIIDVTHKEAN